MYNLDVFEKIKLIRKIERLNQKEYAKKLNVTQSTISKYEKKERTPDYETISKLFEVFNINPNWFFLNTPPIYNELDYFNTNITNILIVQDIKMILTPKQYTRKLESVLSGIVVDQITSSLYEQHLLRKIFNSLQLGSNFSFRVLLFIYHLFLHTEESIDEVSQVISYQSYLIELLGRYRIVTFKNNLLMNTQMMKHLTLSITTNLSESDCMYLFTNYYSILNGIESCMSSVLLFNHGRINIQELFPKK